MYLDVDITLEPRWFAMAAHTHIILNDTMQKMSVYGTYRWEVLDAYLKFVSMWHGCDLVPQGCKIENW
jgi:hypothetical protein